MKPKDEHDDLGGYRRLIERTLKPVVDKNANKVPGGAVNHLFLYFISIFIHSNQHFFRFLFE